MIEGAAVFNVGDIFDAINGNCFGARVCTFEGVIDGDNADTGDKTILIDDAGDKTIVIDDLTDNSLDVDDIECRNGNPVTGEVLAMGVDKEDIG